MKIMVRSADDDYEAVLIADAMEATGGTVFALTPNGTKQPFGALAPHIRFQVWAKVADEATMDRIDTAISHALFPNEQR